MTSAFFNENWEHVLGFLNLLIDSLKLHAIPPSSSTDNTRITKPRFRLVSHNLCHHHTAFIGT